MSGSGTGARDPATVWPLKSHSLPSRVSACGRRGKVVRSMAPRPAKEDLLQGIPAGFVVLRAILEIHLDSRPLLPLIYALERRRPRR